MKYTVNSLEDTKEVASNWLNKVSQQFSGKDEALLVGLSGHLGAGKTAFVKIVAEIAQVQELVTSPTFVLMKTYATGVTANFPWPRIVHIDAYRLEQPQELEALNFEALMSDKNNLILLEWPENVDLKDFEPDAHIMFEIKGDKREIEIV